MTAPIDYNAVLADLEAKRGQIDAAIAVIRAMIGSGGMGDGGALGSIAEDSSNANGTPITPVRQVPPAGGIASIQSDSFFGMSSSEAVRKFLMMMKRPQTPKVIADALRQGGQVHAVDEKTAYQNAYTALRRGKNVFVQTRTGEWGLVEWYGNKPKGDAE